MDRTAPPVPSQVRRIGRTRASVWLVIVCFLAVSTVSSVMLAGLQRVVALNDNVIVLTQFATAVGALVCWLIFGSALRLPPVERLGWARPLLAALLITVLITAVLVVAELVESRPWARLDPASLGAPLALVLLAQLIGAAGEEVGWRGLVQPLLETRMHPLPAALVTGLLFGAGHFPVIAAGPVVYALFIVAAIELSVLLAWLTAGRSIGIRIAVATALHWLVNITMLIGFSDGDASIRWTLNTVIATALACLACLGLSRRRWPPGVLGH